ncbi:ferritin-like domain-containing protein [Hydrogenimonas sp. SS33]|uniref:ferritin-like domain-containing protein n=1 Tax=Hydrogenimonas leucolamina TaxID=2954236 RepID=UPI00336BDE9D
MARWNYKTIAYDTIDREKIANNDFLFKVITIASFIEITSDLYEKNLVTFYEGDEQIVPWLREVWEPEEIQHGKSLKKYVETVWPEFDWQSAYDGFREEYGKYCTIDEFQPTRAREMLARMVVETGTSTFYKGVEKYAEALGEPILAQIAHNISKDEVYHYDRFDEGFEKYNRREHLGRTDITKVIYARLKEASDEDIFIAHKYIVPGENFEDFKAQTKAFAKQYYPYKMAVKMLMYPLHLNKHVENATASTIQGALKVLGI